MKYLVILLALTGLQMTASAQRYTSHTGHLTFFSATPVENIEAINNEVGCLLNSASGDLQFVVPINSFKFEKATMQTHFNENYMESSKFPQAQFKGKFSNVSEVNFSKEGTYHVKAVGLLTIHGVTHEVSIPGTIIIKAGAPTIDATFMVKCSDYNVKIPSVVTSKVAEEIKVAISAAMTASGK